MDHPSRRLHLYPNPPRQHLDAWPVDAARFATIVESGDFPRAFAYARDNGFKIRVTDVDDVSREAFRAWVREAISENAADGALDNSAGAWR